MAEAGGWLFGGRQLRKAAKRINPADQPLVFNPGAARCHIRIGRRSTTQDDFGQSVNTWPVYFDCYCEIRQLSGRELYQGAEFTSAAQYVMRMRWPGQSIVIQVGDRVFFDSHVYVVQIVNNILMRNVIVELACLEIDGSS